MFNDSDNDTRNKPDLTEHIGGVSFKHIIVICLFLFCLYFVIWIVISYKMNETINKQIDMMHQNKIDIAYDTYSNTGFPFSFATNIDNITYRNQFKTAKITTESLQIKSSLSDGDKITIHIPKDIIFSRTLPHHHKNQKATKTDKSKQIEHYLYQIGVRSQNTKLELSYHNQNLKNIFLNSSEGIIQASKNPDIFRYHSLKFSLKEAPVIIEDKIENILEANFYVYNIQPPAFWKAILKENFTALSGKIYLMNPSYFRQLPEFHTFITRNYDYPEIIINNITLSHNISDISLSGLLRFNGDMKMNGDLILTIRHYRELLQFLTKKGVITPEIATNFRFMLSFLQAGKMIEKNDGTVDVDLTVKDNIVYQDKIKLFEIVF